MIIQHYLATQYLKKVLKIVADKTLYEDSSDIFVQYILTTRVTVCFFNCDKVA